MILSLIFVFVSILVSLQCNSCHNIFEEPHVCNHTELKYDQIITGTHLGTSDSLNITRQKRQIQNFRIYFHYTDNMIRDPNFQALQTQVLNPARAMIESAIKPRLSVSGTFRVKPKCSSNLVSYSPSTGNVACSQGCTYSTTCSGISIPTMFYSKCETLSSNGQILYSGIEGSGVENADTVIIVDRPTCTGGLQGSPCFLEDTLDRPVLGTLQLCNGSFNLQTNNDDNVKLVVHELFHALGFSYSLYAFYRNRDGSPIVPRDKWKEPSLGTNTDGVYNFNDNVAKLVTRQRQNVAGSYTKQVLAFTLPTVLKEARNHFQCQTIDAVDLEDAGAVGIKYSHFDEYFLQNELMSTVYNPAETYMTRLSLALMYDTGWYDVNYCAAETMAYGSNSGCVFALNGCYPYMIEKQTKKEALAPFCNTLYGPGNVGSCSVDGNLIQICYIVSNTAISNTYQYFTSPGYFGGNLYNEYCPINGFIDCRNTATITLQLGMEYSTGANSKCILSDLGKNTSSAYYGSTCLKTNCQTFAITYNNTDQVCSANDAQISIGSGFLKCPNRQNYCNVPTQCGTTWTSDALTAITTTKQATITTKTAPNSLKFSKITVMILAISVFCLYFNET